MLGKKQIEAKTKPFGKASQCSAPPSINDSFHFLERSLKWVGYSYVIGAGGQRGYRGESSQSSGSLSAIFPEGPTGLFPYVLSFVEASPVVS